jgi:hypothetical protein
MMTSYVIGQAMKAGKFKESDLVTIGNDAWATGNPVFKGSSLMFLKPGMQVPVSQLIRVSTCSPVTMPAWQWPISPPVARMLRRPDEQLRYRWV